MKIYFAGSIRGGRGDADLYHEIVRELQQYGEVLTEHVADTELGVLGQDIGDEKIHDRDLAWLKAADYLVAEVTTPSLGVGYEIGKATEWGTPVLCLYRPANGGNARSLSAMIAGSNALTVREYQSPADLKETLDGFLRGK
ncbi:MAG: nucleoside 2-deoxyribosyltransferase [Pyrinomonadaceae bacterium]